jgi:hypothetical protein
VSTELVTLTDIKNRVPWDYNFVQSGFPLSGFELETGAPESSIDSITPSGVTLDVTLFFEGRLNQPAYRIAKDLKALAGIVEKLGDNNNAGPKKFILTSEDDEESGYLETKVIEGDGILITKVEESSGFEYLQLDVRVKNSIEIDTEVLQLVNDESSPGVHQFYGTSTAGTKGWHSFIEHDTRVSITASDAASEYLYDKVIGGEGIAVAIENFSNGEQGLDFAVNTKNSIEIDSDFLQFLNDENAPGNSKFYGTSLLGVKGWLSPIDVNNQTISISATDSNSNYLDDKIIDGEGILKSISEDSTGLQTLDFSVNTKNSITIDSDYLQFVNDELAPGNSKFYGTSLLGVKGWLSPIDVNNQTISVSATDTNSSYLDDKIVDGDGLLKSITLDSAGEQTLDLNVNTKNSITIDSDFLQFVNDSNAPGNSKFYGTTVTGVKGWQSLPIKNSIAQDTNQIQLVNDELVPGTSRYYGTNNTGVKGFFNFPIFIDGEIFAEHSLNVSTVVDSSGTPNHTLSLVNDEQLPGNQMFYGTDILGTKGWYNLDSLPNEIGLGGDPDDSSIGIDYPVLRRCTTDIVTGIVTNIGTSGNDIILSSDGVTADQQIVAAKVWNAVWNDIVDFQKLDDKIRYGKCYYDSDTGAKICNKQCQKSVIGIASDTFGFALGIGNGQIPIAVTGWVLAYVDKEYERGTPLTNDKNGNLTEMVLEEKHNFPERIVGIYKKKEKAITWGLEGLEIKVNGRHWIKVK